jgi:hypothetical protein
MVSSFFSSNNCSGSRLSKNWQLCTQLAASARKKLHATGGQSHSSCTQVATSRIASDPLRPIPALSVGHMLNMICDDKENKDFDLVSFEYEHTGYTCTYMQ